jgi:hypothetical protein
MKSQTKLDLSGLADVDFSRYCRRPERGQSRGKGSAIQGRQLLIVHADDVAETHAVNAATFRAFESGAVNSASIMVPCPWFPEAADYAKSHPEGDFGLHLTLTSERVYYRWGPVAGPEKVPSLVDRNGYFHHDWDQHLGLIRAMSKPNCARRSSARWPWAYGLPTSIRINIG